MIGLQLSQFASFGLVWGVQGLRFQRFFSLTSITNQSMGSVGKVPAWSPLAQPRWDSEIGDFAQADRWTQWPWSLWDSLWDRGTGSTLLVVNMGDVSHVVPGESMWEGLVTLVCGKIQLLHKCGKPTVFPTNMIFKWWSCHIGMLVCHRNKRPQGLNS